MFKRSSVLKFLSRVLMALSIVLVISAAFVQDQSWGIWYTLAAIGVAIVFMKLSNWVYDKVIEDNQEEI